MKVRTVPVSPISYESFVAGIKNRDMDSFTANGPQIILDTTDFDAIDREALLQKINDWRDGLLYESYSYRRNVDL